MASEGAALGADESGRGRGGWEARKRRVPYWLMAPSGLYLLIFLVVPLGILVYTSLQSGGAFSGSFWLSAALLVPVGFCRTRRSSPWRG